MNTPNQSAPMAKKRTILDLDAMLDTKASSIETLPDYMNPGAGIYAMTVKECATKDFEVKDPETKKPTGSKAKNITLTYSIDETLSIADGELPVPNGTLYSERFQPTEQGLEFFKKRVMGITGESEEGLADATIGEMMGSLAGIQNKVKVTIRKTKGDNGETYENVNLQFVREAG